MKNKINLPFWETIRRSIMYLLLNFKNFQKICAVWAGIIIFEALTNFPSLCGLDSGACEGKVWTNISVAVVYLSSVSIIIAFCRQIVLKEVPQSYLNFNFGKRELKYILFSFFYLLIIILPSFIAGFLLGLIFNFSGIPTNQYMPFVMILVFVYIIFSARLYLIFPAVAVDNKEIDFRKSFEITIGNANKIFWGQTLVMIPVFAALLALSMIYRVIGSDNFIVKLFFSSLLLIISFIDAGFKASFFAHIYQYFMYFHNKELEEKK